MATMAGTEFDHEREKLGKTSPADTTPEETMQWRIDKIREDAAKERAHMRQSLANDSRLRAGGSSDFVQDNFKPNFAEGSTDSSESVVLDPADPFDAALIPIVQTNRRKRTDYALDGDAFSNFKATALMLGMPGFGAAESSLMNVIQKLARLQSLRANGRLHDPSNEAVEDTFLDLAVYAVITYAIVRQGNDE